MGLLLGKLEPVLYFQPDLKDGNVCLETNRWGEEEICTLLHEKEA